MFLVKLVYIIAFCSKKAVVLFNSSQAYECYRTISLEYATLNFKRPALT